MSNAEDTEKSSPEMERGAVRESSPSAPKPGLTELGSTEPGPERTAIDFLIPREFSTETFAETSLKDDDATEPLSTDPDLPKTKSHRMRAGKLEIPGFEHLVRVAGGGMGVIYKAHQTKLNRDVALKFLPPAFAADPVRLQRFHTEAKVAAKVSHSQVIEVYDILQVDGCPVLVMPFVEGWDLGKILEARKEALLGESTQDRHSSSSLTVRDYLDFILPILDQLVDAVAVVHQSNILHRDIKPSNLVVDRSGRIKLLDFGLARVGQGSQITQPGRALGTRGYMSPEQARGEPDVDGRSDLFSLGVTIYHAITLELPYGKDEVRLNTPLPRKPSLINTRLPRDFDAVILKAIEPDKALRYASVEEFRSDWQRLRSGLDPKVRPVGWPGRLVRQIRREPKLWASSSLLTIILAGWGLSAMLPAPPAISPTARSVRVETDPPGARFVLAALDEVSGTPREDRLLRPASGAVTPGTVKAEPGDYLVVVEWPDGSFHEVHRRVPTERQAAGVFRHNHWDMDGSLVILKAIEKPPPHVLENMALVPGSGGFVLKDTSTTDSLPPPQPPPPRPPRGISTFYLDRTEVTVKQWVASGGRLLPETYKTPPSDDEAIRFVSYDQALHYAERMGKRLPTEAEFKYAATNGGTTRFPWGDDPKPIDPMSWKIGRVGIAEFDRTPTTIPILGLYSNVVEWTSNHMSTFGASPTNRAGLTPFTTAELHASKLIQGGPISIALDRPDSRRPERGIDTKDCLQAVGRYPGVGFRCARSARPRFLSHSAADAGS